jgi:hypothetical protein
MPLECGHALRVTALFSGKYTCLQRKRKLRVRISESACQARSAIFLACFFLDIFDFDKEKCRLKMSKTFSKTRHFSQRNYQNQNQKYRIFIASKYLSNIFSLSYDIEGNLIKHKSIYQQS